MHTVKKNKKLQLFNWKNNFPYLQRGTTFEIKVTIYLFIYIIYLFMGGSGVDW